MFCLKRDHFAFLASLYFWRGSRCSPPGRHLLSRGVSIPFDFLYSSLGIHVRFSGATEFAGSGFRFPIQVCDHGRRFQLRLAREVSRLPLRLAIERALRLPLRLALAIEGTLRLPIRLAMAIEGSLRLPIRLAIAIERSLRLPIRLAIAIERTSFGFHSDRSGRSDRSARFGAGVNVALWASNRACRTQRACGLAGLRACDIAGLRPWASIQGARNFGGLRACAPADLKIDLENGHLAGHRHGGPSRLARASLPARRDATATTSRSETTSSSPTRAFPSGD